MRERSPGEERASKQARALCERDREWVGGSECECEREEVRKKRRQRDAR